tara:strand:- start:2938 stop:3357 length:420 start_codon:yes stop_codon:yes gene_type:complete
MPTVCGLGYELWGIEGGRHAGSQLIRVYIDKSEGVTVDDCEKVSRQLGDLIEAEQAVPGNYVLEVSSPGFERRFFKLQQHQGFIGEKIRVALRDTIDGKRVFRGTLVEVLESSLVILSEGNEYTFEFTEIERSSLIYVG